MDSASSLRRASSNFCAAVFPRDGCFDVDRAQAASALICTRSSGSEGAAAGIKAAKPRPRAWRFPTKWSRSLRFGVARGERRFARGLHVALGALGGYVIEHNRLPNDGASDRRTLRGMGVWYTRSPKWLRTSAATCSCQILACVDHAKENTFDVEAGIERAAHEIDVLAGRKDLPAP